MKAVQAKVGTAKKAAPKKKAAVKKKVAAQKALDKGVKKPDEARNILSR